MKPQSIDRSAPFQGLTSDAPAYRQALDYLYGRINYEKLSKPSPKHPMKLVRMRALLAEMGNPQSDLRIVHIGGTKGKGSTATMVSSIATAAGYRCGLYTSPHLETLEERFQVDRRLATPEQVVSLIDFVHSAADAIQKQGEGEVTFFEMTTAIAIEHFRRSACDLVALEVGLGGRLDSTNVCLPLVTAITSIGLDHQHVLGDTVELIAAEKAGIIKPGIPCVSGVQNRSAADVIRQVASEKQAPFIELNRHFCPSNVSLNPSHGGATFDLTRLAESPGFLRERRQVQLALAGEHQVRNAAVALAIIDSLNHQIESRLSLTDASCRQALANLRIPGRIESFDGQPQVVLDTAHNRDSIAALRDVIEQRFADRDVVVVFGTSHDKDAREMIDILGRCCKHLLLTRYRTNPRWYPPQQLALLAAEVAGQNWQVIEDAHDAIDMARRLAGPGGVVVVCGSFFLAAEVRPNLVKQSIGEGRNAPNP
ncbi:MAG: folylpolyglutamate synthase/dihydrofolate synthase family protein [Pirellulaceae bacterium]